MKSLVNLSFKFHSQAFYKASIAYRVSSTASLAVATTKTLRRKALAHIGRAGLLRRQSFSDIFISASFLAARHLALLHTEPKSETSRFFEPKFPNARARASFGKTRQISSSWSQNFIGVVKSGKKKRKFKLKACKEKQNLLN